MHINFVGMQTVTEKVAFTNGSSKHGNKQRAPSGSKSVRYLLFSNEKNPNFVDVSGVTLYLILIGDL